MYLINIFLILNYAFEIYIVFLNKCHFGPYIAAIFFSRYYAFKFAICTSSLLFLTVAWYPSMCNHSILPIQFQ